MIELLEVDPFVQRLVACRIQNVVYHLVQQGTLIDVTLLQNLLQGAGSLRNVLSGRNDHLRNFGRPVDDGLQFKRREGTSIGSRHRILMVLYRIAFSRTTRLLHLFRQTGSAFGGRHILLQIPFGFHQFQIMYGLRKAPSYIFFKLLLTHLDHLFDIAHLQIEEAQKREAHYNTQYPNRSLFHKDKINSLPLN